MECAIATDIGLLREENQDIVRAEKYADNVLAVICDGMGGERSGLEASEKAVEIFFDHFSKEYNDNLERDDIRKLLISSVSAANSVVYSLSKMNYRSFGMGTTLVAAFVTESFISLINIGDSRAYYYDKGKLLLLTNDHTVVNMLIEKGKITESEAYNHPQRHMLTRAVGVEKTAYADYYSMERTGSSKLLLCSDGLSSYCSDLEVCEIMSRRIKAEETVKELMHLALDMGGRDNISVAVIVEKQAGGQNGQKQYK